jgi:hypothetical protein
VSLLEHAANPASNNPRMMRTNQCPSLLQSKTVQEDKPSNQPRWIFGRRPIPYGREIRRTSLGYSIFYLILFQLMTPFSNRRTPGGHRPISRGDQTPRKYADPNLKLGNINFVPLKLDTALMLIFARMNPADRMTCLLVNQHWRYFPCSNDSVNMSATLWNDINLKSLSRMTKLYKMLRPADQLVHPIEKYGPMVTSVEYSFTQPRDNLQHRNLREFQRSNRFSHRFLLKQGAFPEFMPSRSFWQS